MRFAARLVSLALTVFSAGCTTTTTPGRNRDGTMRDATLTILHTNDVHGHITPWVGWEGDLAGKSVGGFDRVASVAKSVRAEVGEGNVLLLDAGDAVGDTMIAAETKGRAIFQVMEAAGYDAMTLGNHEPDFATATLRQYVADAPFPMLAADVLDERTGQTLAKPFIVREVAGVKVGVLGLAYPNTPLTTAKKNVAGLRFRPDSAAVVQENLPPMRKAGAQVIIVLSHLGLGADKALAEKVEGIDVIVGGHSHNRMREPLRVGGTLIVQAGAHGSDVGRLDLVISDGRIADHRRQLITLDHAAVPSDPQVAKLIASIVAPLRPKLAEWLGEATSPIVRAQTLAGQEAEKRDAQSPADSLFADIVREQTGSDVALLPGVGYGVAIQRGPITAADLRNLIPHDSKVITMALSGEQIRQILEQSVENTYTSDTAKKVGGMIQVSGLTFTYDPNGAAGERVRRAEVNAAPLDSNRQYAVATNSMLAEGGHNYLAFTEGGHRREHMSQYQMVRAWIVKTGKLNTPSDNRIVSRSPAP